jgi:hypothetical protein
MRHSLLLAALAIQSTMCFPLMAQQRTPNSAKPGRPAPKSHPAQQRRHQPSTARAAVAAPVAPARLACAPLDGQVLDVNSRPLVGATILVKGTPQAYATDADGRFHLPDPVYADQVLAVEAAGYTAQELHLTDCSLPTIMLNTAPGARIRQSGKRAGQVIRLRSARL